MKRSNKRISLENTNHFKEKLLHWAQQFETVAWLDSNIETLKFSKKYSNYTAILAVGAEKKLEVSYQNAFEKLKTFQKETQDYLFGYFGYDLKNDLENLHSNHNDFIGFKDLCFFQPKKIFLLSENHVDILYLNSYKDQVSSDLESINNIKLKKSKKRLPISIKQRISKKEYFEKVQNILNHIHRGDIYEVNFCQEFYAENKIDNPLSVYQKLNDISKAPFSSFLKLKDKFLLSASPERFVKKEGEKIISQPIKGTARRSPDPEEDENISNQLSTDNKERSENIMIVDLVRNDLSKTAIKGSVEVEELCKVYSFKQVHQMISTVVSRVTPATNSIDIIKSLFPMGSMTGAPKISAMEIIEELEETKRGLYSGAVGYFTPENDFDFNVVIRSILYNNTNQYISFSVGSAITAQSSIENEYQECLLKANAMKKSLEEI